MFRTSRTLFFSPLASGTINSSHEISVPCWFPREVWSELMTAVSDFFTALVCDRFRFTTSSTFSPALFSKCGLLLTHVDITNILILANFHSWLPGVSQPALISISGKTRKPSAQRTRQNNTRSLHTSVDVCTAHRALLPQNTRKIPTRNNTFKPGTSKFARSRCVENCLCSLFVSY